MRHSKRLFDFVSSLLGILILSPLLFVIAAMIICTDGKPVLFEQERVGFLGKRFRIYKFRTMVVNADKEGRQITVGADKRITHTGVWLRQTKLDELPQLFNVIRGEMSLVGPRPEVPHYVSLYTQEQRQVLNLVPGITDVASIRYRHESEILAQADDPDAAYIFEIMPEKIRLNLEYARTATLWKDIGILVQTFLKILS